MIEKLLLLDLLSKKAAPDVVSEVDSVCEEKTFCLDYLEARLTHIIIYWYTLEIWKYKVQDTGAQEGWHQHVISWAATDIYTLSIWMLRW